MTPAPTVYLFTDVADSTRLWERDPERMGAALAEHDALVAQAIEAHRGRRIKGTGDGVHAVFAEAADALAATVQLQLALEEAGQRSGWPLAVRCGVHQGVDQARDGDFFGNAVNRAARLMAAAHGGQVLVSGAVAQALSYGAQRRLADGLALQPLGALRLRGLARPEAVHQLLAPGLRQRFPALRALEAPPHNLAQPLNRFIGRAPELAALADAAAKHRLLTLVGPGGIGKSRLLLQLAHARLDVHVDGVWWVELAPLREAGQLAPAVAAVLGVKEEPGQDITEALLRFVRDRQLLLVLDNCEQVLAGTAALAKALLQAGPGVTLAASSRELLRVAGERAYVVPPLAVPALQRPGQPHAAPQPVEALAELEAVQLFVDRAQSADPAWRLDDGNAAAVAEICHRLDGIPLALELAAARTRALPVSTIAERLRGSLALLTTRDETVPPRQRTLRLLIDWSHDLLAEDERRLWRRLSVFAGGWTLDLAEAVCADDALPAEAVIDTLAALVDKSLVVAEPARGRWRLLETMRQYADERLAEAEGPAPELRRRHAAALRRLAETARRHLASRSAAGWMARLDTERDNLSLALAASAHDDTSASADTGLALCAALWPYWLNRGLVSLGLQATLAALAHPQAQRAGVQRARALFDAGQMCNCLGRWAQARGLLDQALALLRALGDAGRAADVLQPLGLALMGLADNDGAGRCFAEAVAAERTLGRPPKLAAALTRLALWHRSHERHDDAQALFEEALTMARAGGDEEAEATTLLNLAMVQLSRGRPAPAAMLTAQALALARHSGAQLLHLAVLDMACGLAIALDDGPRARRWQAAADALCAGTGLQRDPADAAFLAPWLARLATWPAAPEPVSGPVADEEIAAWLAQAAVSP